jgi:hypothetical protein
LKYKSQTADQISGNLRAMSSQNATVNAGSNENNGNDSRDRTSRIFSVTFQRHPFRQPHPKITPQNCRASPATTQQRLEFKN